MSNKPSYEELGKKLIVAQKYAKLGRWEFDINAALNEAQ